MIWITWENQRRNRSISKELNINLYELSEIDKIRNIVKKYITGLGKTLKIIRENKPKVIVTQNPSIILSIFSVLYCKIFGLISIVDAHNSGLFPKEGQSKIMMIFSHAIQKFTDLTIVTNKNLKQHVKNNGGRAFVLQDPVPEIPKTSREVLGSGFNCLFICSFADDEPYQNVIEAAKMLPSEIHIYITGNFKKRKINHSDVPENITFLGYLSEQKYIAMLNSVNVTIDLTEREDCLVCGAYESVATEKPMILSDTKALRDYFYKGAIFTANSPKSIKKSILNAKNEFEKLSKEILELKNELPIQWQIKKKKLLRIMNSLIYKQD